MLVARILKNKIVLLALLSFLAITGITFFKSALELEDAEQAYYSQWLRWGYDDQPPLYTWFQYGVNQIFGIHKISFSLLRGLIFSSILLLMGQFSRKMVNDQKKAELAVLGLVLLPVFIDFTFRRLSHTSLLCLAILAFLLVIQRLMHHKTWENYALFGLVVSIGMLSKYNFALFLGAFGLVLFFDGALRRIVLNEKILLSLFIIILLLIPHFYWLLESDEFLIELSDSIALKMENSSENTLYVIGPLFSVLWTLVKLLAPLLVVLALALAFKKVSVHKTRPDWFTNLALSQLTVLVLFFVVLNVQKVEERWLLPLVLPFMVLLVRSVEFRSARNWSVYAFAIFIFIIVAQVVRTPVEKLLGIPSSVHFGFEPLSKLLQQHYKAEQWILPNVTYGGNIRILNPHKELFSKDDFSLPKSKLQDADAIEVILGRENLRGRIPLEEFLGFGIEKDTLFILNFESDALSFE